MTPFSLLANNPESIMPYMPVDKSYILVDNQEHTAYEH